MEAAIIENEEQLIDAVQYVVTETSKLCKKVIGKELPIHSLTVFSHEQREFENLKKILAGLGSPFNENNGPRAVLRNPIQVERNTVTHLRIRKPDSERPQVGCNDFDIENYEQFKGTYLAAHPQNLRLIVRPEYEMIEFFDPMFDVLAYVVSK